MTTEPEIELMCQLPSKAEFLRREMFKISLKREFNRTSLPEPHEGNIARIWKDRRDGNPTLWNGTKFRLSSILDSGEGLTFNLGVTCYMDFLGTNWSPVSRKLRELGWNEFRDPQAYMSDALGVGALVMTSDDHVVLLERSQSCGEAQGLWDVPGGHAEPEEIVGKVSASEIAVDRLPEGAVVDEIYDSVLREIRDETGIPLTELTDPRLMGVARNNTSAGRPSMAFFTRTAWSSKQVSESYSKGSHSEADESTGINLMHVNDFIQCENNTNLWDNLAPSAKGCAYLFAFS